MFLYFFLALLAPITFIVAILLFSPFIFDAKIHGRDYSLKLRFLGFWYRKDNDGEGQGFLFREFRKKPEESKEKADKPDKSKKTGKKADKTESEKAKKAQKEPPLKFWLRRRHLIIRIVALVLRFVFEVLTSFRVADYHIYLKIGNGSPDLTGALYGWLQAFKAWYPNLKFDFDYDFTPFAPWDYSGRVRVRNSLFRLLFWPLAKLLWRLPKLEMISFYREYKKLTKSE